MELIWDVGYLTVYGSFLFKGECRIACGVQDENPRFADSVPAGQKDQI